jgi:nucleotide-binding universal stress UspA family protein
VRVDETDRSRVLVVFDGSPASLEDVRRAGVIADEVGAVLEIASAPRLNRWALALGLGGGYDTESVEEEASAELSRELSGAIGQIPLRVQIETRVVKESAARFVRRCAGSPTYDVIVHRGVRARGVAA